MKKSYLTLLVMSLLLSTFACEEASETSALEERYSHDIPNCDNGGNPEINCTEWIDFISGSEVDVLVGGGDIVERGTYEINGDQISITLSPLSSLSLVFQRLDANRLQRLGDNSIWTKN